MSESGVATTVLSASLGHTNPNTTFESYVSINHTKSSQQANQAVTTLLESK